MGWFKSLFGGGSKCVLCGSHVDTGASSRGAVTVMIGVDPRSMPTLGLYCRGCEVYVHYRCARVSKWNDGEETYTYVKCPKCGGTLKMI